MATRVPRAVAPTDVARHGRRCGCHACRGDVENAATLRAAYEAALDMVARLSAVAARALESPTPESLAALSVARNEAAAMLAEAGRVPK